MNKMRSSKFYIVQKITLPFLLAILLIIITIYAFIIPEISEILFEQKKEKVKDLCRNTIQLAEQYEERHLSGEFTEEEAKSRFAERVRAMRYGDDLREYFWITDTNQIMIMHPFMPETEGQSMDDFTDPNGKRIFFHISELVKTNEFGYIDYIWQLKDNTDILEEKVSYVHLFKPWNWVIGTGVYYSDIQKDTALVTNNINIALTLIVILTGIIVFYIILREFRTETYRLEATTEKEALIKQLKLTNDELNKARKKAEEANKAKDVFLANVSHDLRTPLNGIVGFSKLIQEDETTRNSKVLLEYTSNIQNSGKYLLKMINDILDFSRATAKKITLDYVVFSLNSLISEVKNSFNFLTREKDINILFKDSEEIMIKADEMRLKKVFYNLLSNAIKYSQSHTNIVIRLHVENDEILIDFQDNGIGISEGDQERIFHPFEQVNRIKTEGTGLGLAIAKEICELHEGSLTLKSRTDEGSTFTVHLPKKLITTDEPQIGEKENCDKLKDKQVYVVEDDRVSRKFIQLFLRKYHVNVSVFSTDDNFPESTRQQIPDAVLISIQLSDINESALTQKISSLCSESIPVIALTDDASDEKRKEILSAGFSAVCLKPIEGDQLIKTLCELTE